MEIRRTLPGNADFGLFEAVLQHVDPEAGQGPLTGSLNRELLQQCFIAVSNGLPVGRLALYENLLLLFGGRKTACFGNYVCADDPQTARELLETAMLDATDRGFGCALAPLNGSIWHGYGFGPDCQRSHHDEQFSAAGFAPIKHYASFLDTEMHCNDPQLLAREAELLERGVLIRSLRIGMLAEELEALHPFMNLAFSSDDLYTPIAAEAFRDRYVRLSNGIDPEMALVAEDRKGGVVGFVFGLPDRRRRSEKQLVLETLARHPDERWSGIDAVLVNRVISYARQRGYGSVFYPSGGLWRRSTGVNCGGGSLFFREL